MKADFTEKIASIREEAYANIERYIKEHGVFLYDNEVFFDSGANGSYPCERAVVSESFVYGFDCEVRADYDAEADDDDLVSAIMGYEEVALDSLVEISDFTNNGNLRETVRDLVREAKKVIKMVEKEPVEITAATNIMDNNYDFFFADVVRADSKKFYTKQGEAWSYSHLKSDDLMPVVDGIVNALQNKLSQEEITVIEKLARKSKMDSWLSIDENGVIYDLENKGKVIKLTKAIDQMLEGLVKEDYDCLDVKEMVIFLKLLRKIK